MNIAISDTSLVEKWKQDRWGKFTGSECHKLADLGKPMEKGSTVCYPFTEAGYTYIQQVATQRFSRFNDREKPLSFSMKMGKINEPQSYAALRSHLGNLDEFQYFGDANPLFVNHPTIPNFGVTADARAVRSDGTTSFGAELKNPEPETHFYYLRTIKTENDLYKHEKGYWWQCQACMMVHDCDLWIWMSYDEYSYNPCLIIEVKADKAMQRRMQQKLIQAETEVDKYIQLVIENAKL